MAEIKQNIVQCPTCGNYYDADRYQGCPFCASGNFPQTDASGASAGGGFPETQPPKGAPVSGFPTSEADFSETQYASDNFPGTMPPINGFPDGTIYPGYRPDNGGRNSGRMTNTQMVDGFGNPYQPSPVVGWLVVVNGGLRGTDYRLHAGYNFIGREIGDVCINDATISGERDTSITYVAKTNRFYIAHEQGKNVLLVNDEPVLGGGRELNNYDVITVGNTQLVFVGLCGAEFTWGDAHE